MQTDSKVLCRRRYARHPTNHKSIVLDGDPATRSVECATDLKADLIVMPTYHGRFRAFLIGSVTTKVLHDVECPVLTGVHNYNQPL